MLIDPELAEQHANAVKWRPVVMWRPRFGELATAQYEPCTDMGSPRPYFGGPGITGAGFYPGSAGGC